MNGETVNKPTTQQTDHLNAALTDFGVPKKRQHFVNSKRATSTSRTGRETAIQNLASDEWRPRFPEQKPHRQLGDRVPFVHRLSGYDPDRIACAEYPWTVP